MTEISFYHLSTSSLDKALPAILARILTAEKNALILFDNQEIMEHYNNLLWSFSSRIFIPHGSVNEEFREEQPIYLTNLEENLNNATILITISKVEPKFAKSFDRWLYFFDSHNEEELKEARNKWQKYSKQKEFETVYWKQNDQGSWEKQ